MESEQAHIHRTRYTIILEPDTWWQRLFGRTTRRIIVGIRGSVQYNELLIFTAPDKFYSINYARVRWIEAEAIPDAASAPLERAAAAKDEGG